MNLSGLYLIRGLALLNDRLQETHSRLFSGKTTIQHPSLLFRTLSIVCCLLIAISLATGQQQPPQKDLTDQSLDELANIQVTSVSRKEQKLFRAAAAVYVITQEDIRRSGLSTIPELLRMVPGINVAQISANTWAITARGFNSQFGNKMLVLVDGRSVYSPDFSGVYWDAQDLILDDIERIEVIRGPGATIWGANAVNGVINITTKRSSETQGGLVRASTGNQDYGTGEARYGGKISDNAYYRVYAKYFNRSGFEDAAGNATKDAWRSLHSGFRLDWQSNTRDAITVQGDIYTDHFNNVGTRLVSIFPPMIAPGDQNMNASGGNVLARWDRVVSPRSDVTLQFYYDRNRRHDTLLNSTRDTLDFDFAHHILVGNRQDIVWGGGFRVSPDSLKGSLTSLLVPVNRTQKIGSAFVQDEITVVENRVHLTVGSKFEHNSFSGFNVQPSVRVAWTPGDRQTIWAAASRAVRTPSRSDKDVLVNYAAFPGANGLTNLITILGNPDFKSEILNAYELGYRIQATNHLSLDIASFYNIYKRLEAGEPQTPFFDPSPVPHVVIPVLLSNTIGGKTYGVEVLANWNATNHWKLTAGYSWLRMQLHPDASSLDTTTFLQEQGSDPHHQIQVRSLLSLPHRVEFDTSLYYVDKLAAFQIPSYVRLDLRLGWRFSDSLDFSVGGQNLLNARHAEFGDNQTLNSTFVKRTAYGKITWRF